MNYIINYCSGGLGNRLLPLSSCFELSKKLSRNLGFVWKKTDSCYASFNSLFQNEIENIDLKKLDPAEVSIYSYASYITSDYELNKDPDLYNLYRKTGLTELSNLGNVYQDQKKYIIIYDNHFFLNLIDIQSFLEFLVPVKVISDTVNKFASLSNISKSTLGVHVRGTDFMGEKLESYIAYIEKFIRDDPDVKILFCSDSDKWEKKVVKQFPTNIIIRSKTDHVKKNSIFFNWANNIHRSEKSVVEGIIDIYLLSRTSFVVYNKASTFAQLVNHVINIQ